MSRALYRVEPGQGSMGNLSGLLGLSRVSGTLRPLP